MKRERLTNTEINRRKSLLRIARSRILYYGRAGYTSDEISYLEYFLENIAGVTKLPTSKTFAVSDEFELAENLIERVADLPTVPRLDRILTELKNRLEKGKNIPENVDLSAVELNQLYQLMKSDEFKSAVGKGFGSDVIKDAIETIKEGSFEKFRDALREMERTNGTYSRVLKKVGKKLRYV